MENYITPRISPNDFHLIISRSTDETNRRTIFSIYLRSFLIGLLIFVFILLLPYAWYLRIKRS